MTTKSKKIPYTKSYIKYRTLAIEANEMLPDDKKLDFNIDGREHYVYRVTDYTRDINQHYYGSHTPPKDKKYNNLIEEFWNYRTSSKKNVLNEDAKENYKVKILKVFNNTSDKMIYEAFLHQYFDVKNNNLFWNKSNQTPFGFDTTGRIFPVNLQPKTKSSIEKRMKTLQKINLKTGITRAKEIGRKAAKTRKQIDPETGLTIDQINGMILKVVLSTIDEETGLTPTQMSMKKLEKTRKQIDPETGLTIDQIRGIKSAKTRKQIDPETGLTIDQINGIKSSETRKQIDPETGLSTYQMNAMKQSKTLNSIDSETGLRLADKYAQKRRKYYDIYHIESGNVETKVSRKELPFDPKKIQKKTILE